MALPHGEVFATLGIDDWRLSNPAGCGMNANHYSTAGAAIRFEDLIYRLDSESKQ